MNKKERLKLRRAIHRGDKHIDEWIDKALESSDYTRNLIFKGLEHVIARQNEFISKGIEEDRKKGK